MLNPAWPIPRINCLRAVPVRPDKAPLEPCECHFGGKLSEADIADVAAYVIDQSAKGWA